MPVLIGFTVFAIISLVAGVVMLILDGELRWRKTGSEEEEGSLARQDEVEQQALRRKTAGVSDEASISLDTIRGVLRHGQVGEVVACLLIINGIFDLTILIGLFLATQLAWWVGAGWIALFFIAAIWVILSTRRRDKVP